MTHRESSHERLCQIVEEQERKIADLTRERDEARAVVNIARKATRPGVAVSVRHPYWLDLVQALWSVEPEE